MRIPDADPEDQNHADPCGCGCGSATLQVTQSEWNPLRLPYVVIVIYRVAEPDPAGAETFGRSRYTEVSAPAPGFGSCSRAN
jgi:hypothetical protein